MYGRMGLALAMTALLASAPSFATMPERPDDSPPPSPGKRAKRTVAKPQVVAEHIPPHLWTRQERKSPSSSLERMLSKARRVKL